MTYHPVPRFGWPAASLYRTISSLIGQRLRQRIRATDPGSPACVGLVKRGAALMRTASAGGPELDRIPSRNRLRALDWLNGRSPPTARSEPVRGDAMGRIAKADTAVRGRLRAARRRLRSFGLANTVPLCGVGTGWGRVHAQLCRIYHLVHNPAWCGDRQNPVNPHCDCHSRLVARQGSRSPYPVYRRGAGSQRSVALLRARGLPPPPSFLRRTVR